MTTLLLIVGGVIFAYWLWGTTRPGGVAGKPMVFTSTVKVTMVAIALWVVVVVASYIPARRAAETDPLATLRAE